MIAIIAVGLPLYFGVVLVWEAKVYQRDFAGPNEAMAKRFANELGVKKEQAEFVIRDVSIGQGYSFLMDAYVPHYLYWEALDMLRKLALVGLVLLVGRGSVAQLSAAIVLSFGFFALQMKTWPYKVEQDNLFRAATEAHVFIVIITALVLKNDLRWEILQIGAYDYVLFISFIVLVPTAFVMTVFSKLRYVQEALGKPQSSDSAKARRALAFDLQALGLATDSDRHLLKRYIDGWGVTKTFAAFLSHYKMEAAAEARILKLELHRTMRTKADEIFLDSDNLTDLRNLLNNVAESDALVLLYTQGVLSRPWCLLELHTAATNNVPIIVLCVQNAFAGDVGKLPSILGDLQSYLLKENPQALDALRGFNIDPSTIGAALQGKLIQDESLVFNPHQSSVIIQSQIAHIAESFVKHVCPENADLLPESTELDKQQPWPVERKYAVYIVHEELNPEIAVKAAELKSWLLQHTGLVDEQVMLHTKVGTTGTRQLNDAQPPDTQAVKNDTDCVLLVQSANVLLEPRCVAALYAVTTHHIPIVCTVVMTDEARKLLRYDFATASQVLENLPTYAGAEASLAIANATGTSTKAVGLELCKVLPNIISKPLSLDESSGDNEGEFREIERTLRQASTTNSTDSDTVRGNPRPEPANRTAKLTSKQVAQLRAAFAKMDADGDGGITKVEIMDALRSDADLGDLLGIGAWARTGEERVFEAGRLFQSMDADGDHSIDIDEFIGYFGGAPVASAPSNDVDIEACDAAKGEPTATEASLVEELVPSGARP